MPVYKVETNARFSIDGLNVIEFTEGQILSNPSTQIINALGDRCSKVTIQQVAPQPAVKPKAKRKSKAKVKPVTDDSDMDDLFDDLDNL